MPKNPIILVPGIQGTKLANINKKDFDTIWSGVRKFYDNIHDLALHIDGTTDLKNEIIVERMDVEDLAYSEIINYLRAQGYPVYIFGYDWRKSNLETAEKLLEVSLMIKKKHRGYRINYLTHSMGCLVVSGLYKITSKTRINYLVDRVIFTVPPFLGSCEAVFNLIIGRSRLFNSSDDFRFIARSFPAIFELCPVYEDAMAYDAPNMPFDIYNYAHWQQNPASGSYDTIKQQYTERLKNLKEARRKNFISLGFTEKKI